MTGERKKTQTAGGTRGLTMFLGLTAVNRSATSMYWNYPTDTASSSSSRYNRYTHRTKQGTVLVVTAKPPASFRHALNSGQCQEISGQSVSPVSPDWSVVSRSPPCPLTDQWSVGLPRVPWLISGQSVSPVSPDPPHHTILSRLRK